MATPRADDRRDGCGRGDAPLSSTETEHCHSHQGGGGARRARRPTGTEDTPPGVRPGSLSDPGPQRSDRTVRRSSGAVPLLAVPVLAGGDGVDGTALSFLVRRAVEDRKREKEEKEKEKEKARKKKEAQEKADMELAKRDPWWAQHLADMKAMEERRNKASSSSKRKRKKSRKRRTPRTSSLPGRARRRQRQWFACSAGFTGDDVPRVMFPYGVVWSTMLRIMAGMVQKDSCSGMARLVLLMTVHFVLCFLPSLQARDARHHGRYGPGGHVCSWVVSLWFAGFFRCPSRCAPLVVPGPRCPSSWLAWTTGQYGAHRCISWTRFSTCPLLCHVWCLGPDSAVLAVPQLQFITVVATPCCYAEADPHGPGCSDDH